MSILIPIGAAVLQAASFTLDKLVLSMKRVTYKTYIGISFPLIFFITLIIFLIFRPPLTLSLFSGKYFLLIIATILLTIFTNLFFYKALDKEKLSEMEILSLVGNVPLIIVTGLFFVSERNPAVISLALVASFSVIWSHWKRNHFQIAKECKLFLIWILIAFPLRGIVTKILLETWNPISLELVRSAALGLILAPLFYKSAKRIKLKPFMILIMLNILTTVAWILYFFGYQILGVVQTVLIFSLQPLLVYFASTFLLKEKLEWKKMVSFFIILVSIAISNIF